MHDQLTILAEQISDKGKTVFFTGAGISTESGIPDYRGKGGVWDRFRPVYFNEFMNSREARIEFWRQKTELYPDLVKARPNKGHQAIFRLYQLEKVEAVITQNIDGLHQASGLPDDRVIELHGNTTRVRCMSCSKIYSVHDIHKRIAGGDPAPECDDCGGYLKSDTISFGQAMPMDKVEQAINLAKSANIFCVVGSTLMVQPAAHIPIYAKQGGAFSVIINLSDTPCDDMFDLVIRQKAGMALERVADLVAGNRA